MRPNSWTGVAWWALRIVEIALSAFVVVVAAIGVVGFAVGFVWLGVSLVVGNDDALKPTPDASRLVEFTIGMLILWMVALIGSIVLGAVREGLER